MEDKMGSHGTISLNWVRVVEAGIRGNSIANRHFEFQNKVDDVGNKKNVAKNVWTRFCWTKNTVQ